MHHSPRPGLYRVFLAVLALLLLVGTACSLPQALLAQRQPADHPDQPESVTGPGSTPRPAGQQPGAEQLPPGDPLAGDEFDGPPPELRVQPEDFTPQRYPLPKLGRVAFQADEAGSAQREIAPGDDPQEVTVVDGAGLTWTLQIPTGAIDRPTTVRMVPLAGFDGSGLNGALGSVTGGVRLEPDGLQFDKPLRLSVAGAALTGPAFILSGAHDGADVGLSLQEGEPKSPTARILHFSTYFASQPQPDKLGEVNQNAAADYKRLSLEGRALRKAPLDVPAPPSFPLECTDDETTQKNDAALQEFIQNGLNPENDLLARLLEQRRILALTGSPEMGSPGDLEVDLVERVARKATTMMDQYQGQEDKLVSVMTFALKAARQVALLGGDQAVISQILGRLAIWNSQLIDQMIKDIRVNHNYKRIPVVWQVARNAALLGANTDTDAFLEKLNAALRFEVQVRFEVHGPDITDITKAVVPVRFDAYAPGLGQCSGSGTAEYIEAVVDDEGFTVDAPPYPVQVIVKEFDPCNGTVVIGIDRFGSEAETATFTTEDGSETHPWPIAYNSSTALFEPEFDGEMYSFAVTLHNGSREAVLEVLDRQIHEVWSGSLTLEMLHR